MPTVRSLRFCLLAAILLSRYSNLHTMHSSHKWHNMNKQIHYKTQIVLKQKHESSVQSLHKTSKKTQNMHMNMKMNIWHKKIRQHWMCVVVIVIVHLSPRSRWFLVPLSISLSSNTSTSLLSVRRNIFPTLRYTDTPSSNSPDHGGYCLLLTKRKGDSRHTFMISYSQACFNSKWIRVKIKIIVIAHFTTKIIQMVPQTKCKMVCMCICMNVYMYVYVCVNVPMWLAVAVTALLSRCTFINLPCSHTYIHTHTHTHTSKFSNKCVDWNAEFVQMENNTYIQSQTCKKSNTYPYTCTHIHIHTHTRIHIYTHLHASHVFDVTVCLFLQLHQLQCNNKQV